MSYEDWKEEYDNSGEHPEPDFPTRDDLIRALVEFESITMSLDEVVNLVKNSIKLELETLSNKDLENRYFNLFPRIH